MSKEDRSSMKTFCYPPNIINPIKKIHDAKVVECLTSDHNPNTPDMGSGPDTHLL
jgi:hypothetical protein